MSAWIKYWRRSATSIENIGVIGSWLEYFRTGNVTKLGNFTAGRFIASEDTKENPVRKLRKWMWLNSTSLQNFDSNSPKFTAPAIKAITLALHSNLESKNMRFRLNFIDNNSGLVDKTLPVMPKYRPLAIRQSKDVQNPGKAVMKQSSEYSSACDKLLSCIDTLTGYQSLEIGNRPDYNWTLVHDGEEPVTIHEDHGRSNSDSEYFAVIDVGAKPHRLTYYVLGHVALGRTLVLRVPSLTATLAEINELNVVLGQSVAVRSVGVEKLPANRRLTQIVPLGISFTGAMGG
jgi:hypothetical protein